MKSFLPICLMVALVFAVPSGALAKKKGKGGPPPAAPAAPNPANPVEALAPYINDLDNLLALVRTVNKSNSEFLAQSSGRIITLRQEFIGQQESAPDDQKGKFKAAVATCDVISAALEDREKTLGNLESSAAVKGGGKLEAPAKKDNLEQGLHGGSTAKAVGAIVERDRERQAIAQGKAHAKGNDNALTSMAVNQWNQRAIDWRQKIVANYSQIK
ncbi:MAG TPA: hypothetical protein VK961_18655 [Chthoniobacter sp.]|nr:hypothetical protein [Chthoniobacter sp.]